jgi:hypothetical protein
MYKNDSTFKLIRTMINTDAKARLDEQAGSDAGAAISGELASAAQARLLFQPLRLEILQQLAEPRSCGEVGAALGCSAQKVHYHVKALETAGLVRRVGERKVRALTEGVYQAAAQRFWPGAALLHSLGGMAGAQDALSKSYLLGLAEELGSDAARLALGSSAEQQEQPTLSLSAQVALADPRRRSAFLHELKLALQHLAAKYGAAADAVDTEEYKLVLACYPAPPAGPAAGSAARRAATLNPDRPAAGPAAGSAARWAATLNPDRPAAGPTGDPAPAAGPAAGSAARRAATLIPDRPAAGPTGRRSK